ncbi:hypothetical protein Y032_0586g333 [Ancylostoma ceylanicum]|nr:hypothetical protein Y032_0586g333 [Ancylostoma ceylanicum]
MRAREAPAENATQPPLPIQHFVGADRTYAVVWYGVICSVSLALHVTFVIGTRRLCGWNSNFCFTLLFILSLACIIRFTTELIASLTALFYLDWIEYQALWIAFGSLAFAPYFTVVLLNFLITFHRLAYTAFPFKAAEYLNKSVLKEYPRATTEHQEATPQSHPRIYIQLKGERQHLEGKCTSVPYKEKIKNKTKMTTLWRPGHLFAQHAALSSLLLKLKFVDV